MIRTSRFLFIGFVLITTLLGSCTNKSQTIDLTIADADKDITLRVGDTVTVLLESNITTGYTWEWVAAEAQVLKQQGEPEITSGDSKLAGAAGSTKFTFVADSTGTGSLHLIYHRTFEQGIPPIQEYFVSVSVK